MAWSLIWVKQPPFMTLRLEKCSQSVETRSVGLPDPFAEAAKVLLSIPIPTLQKIYGGARQLRGPCSKEFASFPV
jgi:hypothetical protein